MSVGAEAPRRQGEKAAFERRRVSFPCEAIPYLLSTADALIIVVSGLVSGLLYHWIADTPLHDITAYFGVGLVASFVHIVRLGGSGDYDFDVASKPSVLLSFFGAGEVSRFLLTEERDPMIQQSSDAMTLNLVANFVRNNNSSEILLAVPWTDSARIEFVREQVKPLPVSAKLLPDAHVRALSNYASSANQRVLAVELQRAPLSFAEQ